MTYGLQPSAGWYVCMGALVGTSLGAALQLQKPEDLYAAATTFAENATGLTPPTFDQKFGITDNEELETLPLAPIIVQADDAPKLIKSEVTLRHGDTLLGLLQQMGIRAMEAHTIAQSMKGTFDPRDIRVGQVVDINLSIVTPDAKPVLDSLRIKIAPGHDVVVLPGPVTGFVTQSVIASTSEEQQVFTGVIKSSLYESAIQQGVPPQVLAEMIRLFSYDVDFQRDIRRKDSFEIMFSRQVTEDGLVVANGDIEYASMVLRGKRLNIYAYEHLDGFVDHYNEAGKGISKALMRTPINGARLSSSYGRRKHPVLGYTKMHRGVDFAAPDGTPIYAAGDGTIEKRHRWGSFGNYIRIRHSDGFSTAYAHMRSFTKGHRVGSRVRQGDVIGYVGTTGRSTGPHLHYEVHRNGSQVNPMKVRFPASKILAGSELDAFQARRAELDAKWARLTSSNELALLSKDASQVK